MGEVQAVTARSRAVRAVASRYRLIVLATSEQGRGSYANRDPSQRTAALASGKWSGSIEYSARALVALRSVAGESDLIEMEIAKNKHGRITHQGGDPGHVYLKIDRRCQTLTETNYEAPPSDPEARRADRGREKVATDGEAVLAHIIENPGVVLRNLYSGLTAKHGTFSRERTEAALAWLGGRVRRELGARKAVHLYATEVAS
jgi:hypothetical protein